MRKPIRRSLLGGLCAALMALAAAPAQGADPLYTFIPSPPPPPRPVTPPPTGSFNGPCGLAVNSSGQVYVSDYYHHVIDIFSAGSSQLSLPSYSGQIANVDPLDGPCGLAFDGSNNLYVNNYHRDVMKSPPSGTVFNSSDPTGVAVDATGNVYVNNRTYVSKYDSGGTLLDRIGEDRIGNGYGLAVSQFPGALGYVFVPDASTNTVKIFDPAVDRVNPKAELSDPFGRPFVSLRDSAIAVDNATGEVYFADNTQPRHAERPQATIYAYNSATSWSSSTGTWRGYLPFQVISALPPGLTVDNSPGTTQGRVYVTSGNTHQAGYYAYPASPRVTATPLPSSFSLSLSATGGSGEGSIDGDLAGVDCASSCEADVRSAAQVTLTAIPEGDSVFAGWSGAGCSGTGECTVQMSEAHSVSASFEAVSGPPAPPAEVQGASASSAAHASASGDTVITQRGNLRVAVSGKLSPKRLPRDRVAPIAVSVGGTISTTDASLPPQLKVLRVELNRNGKLDYAGLPTCVYGKIQPGSSSRALAGCRNALVGRGSFTANITLAGQEPYPTRGRLLLFNGLRGKKPVLYGHIYSPKPFATSFVIVFAVERLGKGTYGTALNAPLPKAMDAWGRLTGLEMTLSRRYNYKGRSHSYISSGCPAPRGFPGADFPLARTSFTFEGGAKLSSTLRSICKVRG
jgi:Divergent InlB B-repeat domain/NHL repeat